MQEVHGVNKSSVLVQRSIREALPNPRGVAPHALHPAVLPRGQRRARLARSSRRRRPSSSRARATRPSSFRSRCCSPRPSAPPRSTSSRTSRAATSTSCAPRRSRATAIVFGRLSPSGQERGIAAAIVLLGAAFGIRIASGPARLRPPDPADRAVGGRVLRIHAADRAQDPERRGDQLGGLIFFPLLFLTPNFVPRECSPGRWRSPPRSTRSPTSWRRCARSSSRTWSGRRSGPGSRSSPWPAR